jgi:hypothetical protein
MSSAGSRGDKPKDSSSDQKTERKERKRVKTYKVRVRQAFVDVCHAGGRGRGVR